VTELYSKLRRLVLEYLGIAVSPPPDKQRSDVAEMPPRRLTDDALDTGLYNDRRGQSAPVLPTRRSWSRPSVTDSCELTRSNVPAAVVQTKPSPTAPRGRVVSYYYHHHHQHHHHHHHHSSSLSRSPPLDDFIEYVQSILDLR